MLEDIIAREKIDAACTHGRLSGLEQRHYAICHKVETYNKYANPVLDGAAQAQREFIA